MLHAASGLTVTTIFDSRAACYSELDYVGKPNQGTTPNMANQNNPTSGNGSIVAPQYGSTSTVFGPTMKIIGEVSSDEELRVDGELEGKLNLRNKLTIGPASKVNANIKAKEVVIFGNVKGNVEAENRISLRTGASIVGDIKTAGIVIEDGAYFKGGIDISRGDTEKAAEKQAERPAEKPAEKPAALASSAMAGQKR